MKTTFKSGFKRNPPQEYQPIVSAMMAFTEKAGLLDMQAAIGYAIQEATENAFAESYDLVKSEGPLCIQRLLGKPCQAETLGERCECWPPGTDHASLWEKDGKPFAFVFQPYELEQDQVSRLGEFCSRYGLQYSLQGRNSWYYPTHAFLVFITRIESGS